MRLINRFFGPFAALLILSAVYFSSPDAAVVRASVGILAVSFLVNAWLARNSYRYIHWTQFLRHAQIWLDYLWAVPLVWLLGGWWAPMWLLFIMPPVTAAMVGGFLETLGTAAVSSLTLLALYWLRGLEGEYAWGMALVHAAFIPVISLFVHSLAQTTLRGRP